MTNIDHSHSLASGPSEAAAEEPRPARRLSPQVIFDAVLAGYIHDISERHRPASGRRDRLVRAQRFAHS